MKRIMIFLSAFVLFTGLGFAQISGSTHIKDLPSLVPALGSANVFTATQSITNAAPVFQMNDSTASAKDLKILVDGNFASFYEAAGSPGVFNIDLANSRIGIGATAPIYKFEVNGIIAISDGGGATAKDFTITYDTGNNRVALQAVQQNTAWVPISINANGGEVGIGIAAPLVKLDVVGVSHFGDSATNYTAVSATGVITLHGSARVKEEIRTEAVSFSVGASAPTAARRAVGASGGVQAPVLQFSKTVQNDIYWSWHIPDSADATVAANMHIMWWPGASWTSGNIYWKAECVLITEDNGVLLSGTPTNLLADVTPADALHAIHTEIATGITIANDSSLACHLYRDVANDNGNDVGSIQFVELEYTINKLGE